MMSVDRAFHRWVRCVLLATVAAALVAGCSLPGAGGAAGTATPGQSSSPTPSDPNASAGNAADGATAEAGAATNSSTPPNRVMVIDTPARDAAIGSPSALRGRLARVNPGADLIYRVVDGSHRVLGTGSLVVTGEAGQPGTFEGQILYTALIGSPGMLVVAERGENGAVTALASTEVQITVSITTLPTVPAVAETAVPTPLPAQPTFTPAPTLPPTTPTPLPPTATPGPVVQTITFTSPAPGTVVGSPVVITGNTTQFPFQGSLDWRLVDGSGRQLGAGAFAVAGAAGQPSSFNVSLSFALPPGGGPLRLDVYDQDNLTGRVSASSSLNLNVAAPSTPVTQSITITSPPPNTSVGSPVVVTGRTALYPTQGNLSYRVFDANNAQLGSGDLLVSGSPGQPAAFNASLTFTVPARATTIRLEILDIDSANGSVVASTAVVLTVSPPYPAP